MNTFKIGSLNYTVLILKTSQDYTGINSSMATKPTPSNTSALCVIGLSFQKSSTPKCSGFPVHIYTKTMGGKPYYIWSIYEDY